MFLRKSHSIFNNLIKPPKTPNLLLSITRTFSRFPPSVDLSNSISAIINHTAKKQNASVQLSFNQIFEELQKNPSNIVPNFVMFINALKSNFYLKQNVESYRVIKNCFEERIKYNQELLQYFENLPKNFSSLPLDEKIRNFPCIQFIPTEERKSIIEGYIPYLHLIDKNILFTFMNDAYLNDYEISYDFF